jgi:hypothetical protein
VVAPTSARTARSESGAFKGKAQPMQERGAKEEEGNGTSRENTYIRIRIVDKLAKFLHSIPDTHAGSNGSLELFANAKIIRDGLLLCSSSVPNATQPVRWEKVSRGEVARTVLFAIERFDVVASVVVLTEPVLLLLLVEDGVVVPGGSGLGLGNGVAHFALQNVDCRKGLISTAATDRLAKALTARVPSSTASETTSKALASAMEGIHDEEVLLGTRKRER